MSTSFDLKDFSKDDPNITLQGDADIVPPKNGHLELTKPDQTSGGGTYVNVGRALYSLPVTIWEEDNDEVKVASFNTSFSFTIQHFEDKTPADGIIFFLVPVETAAKIPDNSSGGLFGIVDAKNAFNKFVAVEFDIYSNNWDPTRYSSHIGIDVNSVISLKTAKWTKVDGALVEVTITYDPKTEILTASAKYPNHEAPSATVHQAIDLKQVLPSKVRIGLAASQSTGDRAFHNIHSWSFNSKLA